MPSRREFLWSAALGTAWAAARARHADAGGATEAFADRLLPAPPDAGFRLDDHWVWRYWAFERT